MQNQQNLISSPKASQTLALHESEQSRDRLDELLGGCFALQKLYGREVANTGTVIALFQKILCQYPAEKVIRAFEIWLERSQEFPTPADIINLIKRNGRPPLSKERYIAISKKDGADRTREDWQYLRDYEADQDKEDFGSQFVDETKESATVSENIRLRTELRELRAEYGRIGELLRQERQKTNSPAPELTLNDKVQRTVEFMRESGSPQADIDLFLEQYGNAA